MSYDTGGRADALITTRDGIVGSWVLPAAVPVQHVAEDPTNLLRWEPTVRSALFGFELVSRLGVTAEPQARISIWHMMATAPANAGDPPTGAYLPLVRFDRPGEQVFHDQMKFLRSYADLRPDRAVEILEQFGGPAPFLRSIAFLRPDAKRWTLELLDAVMQLARFVEQRAKHALACRRPMEYSPQVQPIILSPGHGSLPSGHATEAFATALVLWRLLQASETAPYDHISYGEQFMRLASRIAVNRTVAGVHFPIDSIAGALLGLTLGDYFVARAEPTGGARVYRAAHFDGTATVATDPDYIGDADFLWSRIYDVTARGVDFTGANRHPSVQRFDEPGAGDNDIDLSSDMPSAPLEWLWAKALAEWT